MCLHW